MPGWGSGGGGPPRGCAASRGRAGGEQGLWGKTEESGVPPASPEQLKLADLKLIGCNFTPHSVGPGLGPAESLEQPSPFLKPKKAQVWGRWGHVSTAGLPLGGRWTEVPRAQAPGDTVLQGPVLQGGGTVLNWIRGLSCRGPPCPGYSPWTTATPTPGLGQNNTEGRTLLLRSMCGREQVSFAGCQGWRPSVGMWGRYRAGWAGWDWNPG